VGCDHQSRGHGGRSCPALVAGLGQAMGALHGSRPFPPSSCGKPSRLPIAKHAAVVPAAVFCGRPPPNCGKDAPIPENPDGTRHLRKGPRCGGAPLRQPDPWTVDRRRHGGAIIFSRAGAGNPYAPALVCWVSRKKSGLSRARPQHLPVAAAHARLRQCGAGGPHERELCSGVGGPSGGKPPGSGRWGSPGIRERRINRKREQPGTKQEDAIGGGTGKTIGPGVDDAGMVSGVWPDGSWGPDRFVV